MQLGTVIFPTEYSIGMDELAPALEARGFESCFVTEHTHIPVNRLSPWPGGDTLPKEYAHTYDPFVCLAFAAATTTTLKIGTGICLLPQRDTLITAKLVSSLDRMSNGRFLFGIGGGWNKEEMNHHGTEYKTRFALLEEKLNAMKGLWTQDKYGHNSELVSFSPSWSYPKPMQQPYPPILLGGDTDYTLDRVARFCDGWLPIARPGFDAATSMARLKAAADRHERDISDISVTVFAAKADPAAMDGLRAVGISRALIALPSVSRDKMLPLLDDYAKLLV
jgi:probable F420-dependent oxidoreductase